MTDTTKCPTCSGNLVAVRRMRRTAYGEEHGEVLWCGSCEKVVE